MRRFPDAFTEVEALGMLWKTYSEEERKPWFGMALEEAKQHAEAYPGFKHSWRKSPKKIKAQCKRQMAPRKFSGSANDVSSDSLIDLRPFYLPISFGTVIKHW